MPQGRVVHTTRAIRRVIQKINLIKLINFDNFIRVSVYLKQHDNIQTVCNAMFVSCFA